MSVAEATGQASVGPLASGEDRPLGLARVDWLLVGALIALLTIVYTVYALRVGNFQNDENQYMELARYMAAHFPGALWQPGIYPRGIQRLDPLLIALPFMWLRGPVAFQIAHTMQCLLFTSTALPVFLLASRAGIGRMGALLAATLAIVMPWAVVATSFLAEPAAYPAYAWVLYTTWRTLRRPSWSNDAMAIGAIAIAALSRTALLALVPLPALAIVWHEWSWSSRGKSRTRRLAGLPSQLWSRHRLFTTVAALALLALLLTKLNLLSGQGVDALAGGYGIPHLGSVEDVLDRYGDYLARMATGTGFLAAAVALPWTLRTLARPRQGGLHALAVVCALGVGAILLSLLQAGLDERYLMYGSVPIALAAAAGLSEWSTAKRPSTLAALGLAGGSVVVAALIGATTWPALASTYDYFTYPAAVFFQRALIEHLTLFHFDQSEVTRVVQLAIVVAACTLAFLARLPRLARPAAAVVGIGLIVVCGTQTVYALRKFTSTAGEARGPSASERSWVDRHVPGGVSVGALALSLGETADYVPIWRATEFWNSSVKFDAYFETIGALPMPLGSELRHLWAQPVSGLLGASKGVGRFSRALVPRYMLVPLQGTNRIGLEAHQVAVDPYLPLTLVQLNQPPRIDWYITNTSPEGFLTAGEAAKAIVYAGAFRDGAHMCASFDLIAPPGFTGRWPYIVSRAGRKLRGGTLTAEQTKSVEVPLAPRPSPQGHTDELTVIVNGSVTLANEMVVSAKLAYFAVKSCG